MPLKSRIPNLLSIGAYFSFVPNYCGELGGTKVVIHLLIFKVLLELLIINLHNLLVVVKSNPSKMDENL